MRVPKPLALLVTDEARRQIRSARGWLKGFGSGVDQRFTAALERELTGLCQSVAQQIADKKPFHPDEQASLAYSRAIYRHRFQTGKTRRRRSSSGVWFVLYELRDQDADGIADTLQLLGVHHAASRPLWEEEQEVPEE